MKKHQKELIDLEHILEVWNSYEMLPALDYVRGKVPMRYRYVILPVLRRVNIISIEFAIRLYFYCLERDLAQPLDIIRWFSWQKYLIYQPYPKYWTMKETILKIGTQLDTPNAPIIIEKLNSSKTWSWFIKHHRPTGLAISEVIRFYCDFFKLLDKTPGVVYNLSDDKKTTQHHTNNNLHLHNRNNNKTNNTPPENNNRD